MHLKYLKLGMEYSFLYGMRSTMSELRNVIFSSIRNAAENRARNIICFMNCDGKSQDVNGIFTVSRRTLENVAHRHNIFSSLVNLAWKTSG